MRRGGKKQKKLLYGKRLEGLEDSRLVKVVAHKLKDAQNVGWWEEYGVLLRKYAKQVELGKNGRWRKAMTRIGGRKLRLGVAWGGHWVHMRAGGNQMSVLDEDRLSRSVCR